MRCGHTGECRGSSGQKERPISALFYFENIEDDLTQAIKIDAALKIASSYTLRDVFYLNTKYGESGTARLKDEETYETVRIYLPKSIKQDIKLTRKINMNKIAHEKIEI